MGEEKMKHKNLKEKRSEDGESGSRLYHHRHPVGRVTESSVVLRKSFSSSNTHHAACPTRETAYLTGVPYLSEKLFSVETSFVITTPRYWIGSDYVTVPDGMGP